MVGLYVFILKEQYYNVKCELYTKSRQKWDSSVVSFWSDQKKKSCLFLRSIENLSITIGWSVFVFGFGVFGIDFGVSKCDCYSNHLCLVNICGE